MERCSSRSRRRRRDARRPGRPEPRVTTVPRAGDDQLLVRAAVGAPTPSQRQRRRGAGTQRGTAFRTFATAIAASVGSAWAFLIALLSCVVWAVAGPYCHYSDTWQLVINTG